MKSKYQLFPLIKRNMNQTLTLSIVIFVVMLGGASLYLSNSVKIYSSCLDKQCVHVNLQMPLTIQKDFNENVEMDLSINSASSKFSSKHFTSESTESIQTWTEQPNILMVGLPMRYGSSHLFPIPIPLTGHEKMLKVNIFDSKEFIVEIDGHLVYSHRYFAPVFYVDPANPWSNSVVGSSGGSVLSIQRLSIDHQIISRFARRILTVSLILSFPIISWLLARILSTFLPSKRYRGSLAIPVRWLVICWLGVVILWLSRARDDTGSVNPSPFGPIGAAFSDMMQIFQAGKFHDPYIYSAVNYPPLPLAIIWLFPFLSVGLLVFAISTMSLSLLWWLASSIDLGVGAREKILKFLIFALPYPVLFSVIRGNLDLLASVLVGFSALSIKKSKFKSAGLLLGFAISLKAWPAVFLLYFLSRKNYKGILVCFGSGLILTFCSFWILGYPHPREQFSLLRNTLGYLNGSPSSSTFIYSYSFSALIFVGILVVNRYFHHFDLHHTLSSSLNFFSSYEYMLVFSMLLIILLYAAFKSTRSESVFFYCSGISLLCSSVSYTYRGSILVVALIVRAHYSKDLLRLNSKTEENAPYQRQWPWLMRYVEKISWVCILAPTTFIYANGTLLSTSSVLQPLSLLYLLAIEFYFERQTQRCASRLRVGL